MTTNTNMNTDLKFDSDRDYSMDNLKEIEQRYIKGYDIDTEEGRNQMYADMRSLVQIARGYKYQYKSVIRSIERIIESYNKIY